MKKILEFTNIEAREFFLKEENYFNFDLPKYFVFQNIINQVSVEIEGKLLSDYYNNSRPSDYDDVNYKILNNKDGKFAWRPLQLIHPALYVSLVHNITEDQNWNTIIGRFVEFVMNKKIQCFSIPVEAEGEQSDKVEMVSNWW